MFNLVPQAAPGITKCRICGRILTDPRSILEGAGPVCSRTTLKHSCDKNQLAFDWDNHHIVEASNMVGIKRDKPELIICLGNKGFDSKGKEIVSGRDEIELATNVLAMFTGVDEDMAREFAEFIKGANRGVVRREHIEEFIKERRG